MAEPAPTIHVIGNLQLDVLASPVTALPSPGGDRLVDRIDVRPGGAAGNVALALAALGIPHRLFSALGDDYAGRWVLEELDHHGLAADVTVVAGAATSISVAIEAPGRDRGFLTAYGVLDSWGEDHVAADAARTDLLLLTGYFSMPSIRGPATARLLREAHAHGATTLLDTGWDPDDWRAGGAEEVLELLPMVDVLLANEAEALALTAARDADEAALALAERSGGWAVVKLGDRGATARSRGGEAVSVSAPPVEAIDTTGAGDSLAAGLLARLSTASSMADALHHGVAVASAAVARPSHDRYPTPRDLLSS